MGKKLSNKEWEDHINQYYSSDRSKTINEFCRDNNLSKQQFHYHKKRISETKDSITTIFQGVKIKSEEETPKKYADETPLKVINDNGKDSKSKKYMWLYMSETNGKPVVLYDYQNTRSSSCPKNFLGNFTGYLQTDGYSGYNSVSEATRIYCLAHIRRKFYEIISNLNEETLKKSRAIIGVNCCEKIYQLEKELRESHSRNENYHNIRFEVRKEKFASLIHEFIDYIDVEIQNALPKSPLGKALDYAKKHVPSLKNVLLDGSLEIDNNAAERKIKPFVICRKNFLFANTSKGATCSAQIYSIIETAKSNKLIVERYLVYLFEQLVGLDLTDSESLENIMPWSSQIPDNLKIKEKK